MVCVFNPSVRTQRQVDPCGSLMGLLRISGPGTPSQKLRCRCVWPEKGCWRLIFCLHMDVHSVCIYMQLHIHKHECTETYAYTKKPLHSTLIGKHILSGNCLVSSLFLNSGFPGAVAFGCNVCFYLVDSYSLLGVERILSWWLTSCTTCL